MSDARAELRNLFADSLRTFKLTSGLDAGCYLNVPDAFAVADTVVDLFDLVERQRTESGHCYVARTNPTDKE